MLRNKIIASVVFVGVICLIFFTIFNPPKRKEFNKLRREYGELDRTLKIARENLKQYVDLEREYDSLSVFWDRLEEQLPEEREIPVILEDIARVANRCGVTLSEFKPLNPVPSGFTNEIPISFKITSGYHQLGRFLTEIASLSRLLKVSKLNLTPYRERDSEVVSLKADFIVSAYVITRGTGQAEGK